MIDVRVWAVGGGGVDEEIRSIEEVRGGGDGVPAVGGGAVSWCGCHLGRELRERRLAGRRRRRGADGERRPRVKEAGGGAA
jgi:hypothetical protein